MYSTEYRVQSTDCGVGVRVPYNQHYALKRPTLLADRTVTQYEWLLAESCRLTRLSICLSVTLCTVALRVGVQG